MNAYPDDQGSTRVRNQSLFRKEVLDPAIASSSRVQKPPLPRFDSDRPQAFTSAETTELASSAENGNTEAAKTLYYYYLYYAHDIPSVIRWLPYQANKRKPIAEYNLGTILCESASKKEVAEGKIWLGKAAKDGFKEPANSGSK